jgi:phospholipid/cholesterol/gamma-HCH transport system substrate-binding protein
MATEAHKFRVGLFVFISVLLIITALIVWGARAFGEKAVVYVTYFAESVQGLEVDSEVKFRGLTIGRVSRIDLAPDGELVEVLMNINEESNFTVGPSNLVRLISANITGMKYLEIEMRNGRPDKQPALSFTPTYPLIPSFPTTKIPDLLDEMQKQISSIQMQKISDRIISALDRANKIMDESRWIPIYTNLETSVLAIRRITSEIDEYIGSGKISSIVDDTTDAARQFKSISEHIDPKKIDDIVKQLSVITTRLNDSTYLAENAVQEMIRDLQRSADNIKSFTEALKDRPSQTLFGEPLEKPEK